MLYLGQNFYFDFGQNTGTCTRSAIAFKCTRDKFLTQAPSMEYNIALYDIIHYATHTKAGVSNDNSSTRQ